MFGRRVAAISAVALARLGEERCQTENFAGRGTVARPMRRQRGATMSESGLDPVVEKAMEAALDEVHVPSQ